jgi:hypothetical protein
MTVAVAISPFYPDISCLLWTHQNHGPPLAFGPFVAIALGYPDDLVGISLMRKAFHPETGPLTAMSLVIAEREAEMHLFSGAIGHAKNPTSHRDVILAPQEAARLVVFASHLLGIIEQRLG